MTLNEMIYHRKSCRSFTGKPVDAGIALAHLYGANPESFRFFKAESVPEIPGYGYIGSVTL